MGLNLGDFSKFFELQFIIVFYDLTPLNYNLMKFWSNSTLLLTFALISSAVGSKMFNSEEKKAALQGIRFTSASLAHLLSNIHISPKNALPKLKGIFMEYDVFLGALTAEQFINEYVVAEASIESILDSLSNAAVLIRDGSASRELMTYFLDANQIRLSSKITAIRIVNRLIKIFQESFESLEYNLGQVYRSLRTPEFEVFTNALGFCPFRNCFTSSVYDLNAREKLKQFLASWIEETTKLRRRIARDKVPFSKLKSILSLASEFDIPHLSHPKTPLSYKWAQEDFEVVEIDDDEDIQLFEALLFRIIERCMSIITVIECSHGEALPRFFDEVKFSDIFVLSCPLLEAAKEAITLEFSDLNHLKARYLKSILLKLLKSEMAHCLYVLNAPTYYQNDINAVLKFGKILKVDFADYQIRELFS